MQSAVVEDDTTLSKPYWLWYLASYLLSKGDASALYISPVFADAPVNRQHTVTMTYGSLPWYLDRYFEASSIGTPAGVMEWIHVNHTRSVAINSSNNLLPDFSMPDQSNESLARGWLDLGVGTYRREATVTHDRGSYAIEVICKSTNAQAGAKHEWQAPSSQPLQASVLLLSGWSKSLVNGAGLARDYSLYVDLTYVDGTLLEGQLVSFAAGMHDWQQAQLRIYLTKPVAKMNIYCLYRNRVGRVLFDGLSLTAHADQLPGVATRQYSGGFVVANPLSLGTPAVRVELPHVDGRSYRDLETNETVEGHVMVLARNATVLLLA